MNKLYILLINLYLLCNVPVALAQEAVESDKLVTSETPTVEQLIIYGYFNSTAFKKDFLQPLAKKAGIENGREQAFFQYASLNLSAEQKKAFNRKILDHKQKGEDISVFLNEKINELAKYAQLYKQQELWSAKVNSKASSRPDPLCVNMDFSDVTMKGWEGGWGECNPPATPPMGGGKACAGANNPNLKKGFDVGTPNTIPGQKHHVAFSNPALKDPITGISVVPPTGGNSVRIGNSVVNGGTGGGYYFKATKISQTFKVSPQHKVLLYSYAVVLDEPPANNPHQGAEQPYFKVFLISESKDTIACATYQMVAADAKKYPGWKSVKYQSGGGGGLPGAQDDVYYKDWETVGIPIAKYQGQNVTLVFITSDCTKGGHFGYAYVSASCESGGLKIQGALGCSSDPVKIIGPDGAFTYKWTGTGIVGPDNQKDVTVNKPGKYKLTMVTKTIPPCEYSLDTVITGAGKPLASFTFTPVCFGKTMNFISNSTPEPELVKYEWDYNNDGSVDASGKTATYVWPSDGSFPVKLTVTNKDGCKDDTVITIKQSPKIKITTKTLPSNCGQATGQASATITGGVPKYTYSWSNGSTDTVIKNVPSGMYRFKVMDSQGCADSVQVYVPDQGGFDANVTEFKNVSCFGMCDGSAKVEVISGGKAPFTYKWATNPIITTATVNNLCAQEYYCIIEDAQGCHDTARVTISQPPKLELTVGADETICYGKNVVLTADVKGGTPAYTVIWSDGTNVLTPPPLPPNYTVSVSPKLNTTYNVTVKDANGCTIGPKTQTITIEPPVKVSVDAAPDTICVGEFSVLTATGTQGKPPYKYKWLNDGTTENPKIVTPKEKTEYTVVVTDACDLTDTARVTVYVNPLPVVVFESNDSTGCVELCVTFLNKTPNVKHLDWDFGDGTTFSTNVQTAADNKKDHCYNKAGKYTVSLTVRDDKGCVNTATVPNMIEAYPIPTADFTFSPEKTTIMDPQIHFLDKSIGADELKWNFGDHKNPKTDKNTSIERNPYHTYIDTGTYCITQYAENQYGCKDEIVKCLRIYPNVSIYVPNAFTPNADGKNETFKAEGVNILRRDKFDMWIFDRWGLMIFHSTDMDKGWDGSVQYMSGEKQQEDVYVWKINAYDILGQKYNLIGHVTLIK